MKRYLVFIIFLFLGNFFYAQNTSKVTGINNAYKFGLDLMATEKYEKAFEFLNFGLQESENIKDKTCIAFGYFYLGTYYEVKKNYSAATRNLNTSLQLFKVLEKEEEIYNCHFKLGVLSYNSSEYDASLENYFTALKIIEQKKEKKKIAIILHKIGEVYLLTRDLKKAQINFYKALTICKEINFEQGVVDNLNGLGASYQKQGAVSNSSALTLKAIDLFKQGLVKARKGNFQRNEAVFLGNIGSSFRSLNKYNESLEYLFRALGLKIKLKRYASAAHSCNDISETYLEMNKLTQARIYALKAMGYAKGLNIHKERFACYLLSKIEYNSGDFKKSNAYLKKYHQIKDSLFSIQKLAKINDLQIKYETQKQHLKIESQKANIALLDAESKVKNQFVLFGSISLLSLFFIITISKSRRNTKKEKIQQEKFSQNLLLSQEEERTRISRELHDSVGQQLTLIKIKSQRLDQKELTVLSNNALEEVRRISRNLYPVLLKQLGLTESIAQLINEYDEQTDLFFSMDIDDIDAYFNESKRLNFYRLLQECLTNIIKHAKATSVSVTIKIEDQRILTLISDNGKGFDVAKSKKKNSLGLKTIFERIRIMNGNISLDSELNKGTHFIFSIPLKNE